jgi:hypothetical protein
MMQLHHYRRPKTGSVKKWPNAASVVQHWTRSEHVGFMAAADLWGGES